MKPILLVLTLFLSVCIGTGQEKKTFDQLGTFTEIKAYDGLSVNLIKSDTNKAVVTGENLNKVAISNSNGVLKLRMQITKIFSGYRTFIDVYYTEELVTIDVNEDARLTSGDNIEQDLLELKAQEGGEISIIVNVEQLIVKAVTGGNIQTFGSSDLQDIAINTGGIYDGKEFKTKFSTINVNAGSRAEIFAVDYVKATVKAGGEVLVYGNPAKMEEKTIFGGKITRM
ncbi:DUF2807 domain-containing protein [Kriegella sp. EG-1]|nr:DUF2807 domain-containing protein [Flavobacteriaceae bacterium EG-1]